MKKILISVLVLGFMVPLFASASFEKSLKLGSQGSSVIELQDFLKDQGDYNGKSDGVFGPGTKKGVIAFQIANNLKGDGYFGLASRAKASEVSVNTNADSNATELQETGSIATTSSVPGCDIGAKYSTTTGQPCNMTIIPIAGLPDGCVAISGYSITTGQKCSSTTPQPVADAGTLAQISALTDQITALTQQLQDQSKNLTNGLNAVALNTASVAQNTTPPPPFVSQSVTLEGEKDSSFQDVNFSGNINNVKMASFFLRNTGSQKVNIKRLIFSFTDSEGNTLSSSSSPSFISFSDLHISAYGCDTQDEQSGTCYSGFQQGNYKNTWNSNFILNPGEVKVIDLFTAFNDYSGSYHDGIVSTKLQATGITVQ